MTRELHGIQILRGFAALSVVIHHALEESNGSTTSFSPDWLTTFGASGVDIFFVISGFIMLYTCFPAAASPLSPARFLFRRITRIYPMYWICCFAMLAIMLLGFLTHHNISQTEIVLSLALIPSSKLIIGVSWTLVFEMYFYVIFAATLLLRNATVSVIATTSTLAIMMLFGETLEAGALKTCLTNPIVFEFILGLWLGLGFARAASHWQISMVWAGFGIILLAAASFFIPHANTNGLVGWARLAAWGAPALMIVAASLSIGAPKNAFTRQMVFLGDASYALYLTHVFVMLGYAYLLKKTSLGAFPQIAIVPLIVLIATVVGIAAHLFVEKPVIRTIRQWTGRKRSSRPLLAGDRLPG